MKTMVDPPSGWKYGFPKEMPNTVNQNNFVQWMLDQGYPQTLIEEGMLEYCRMWMEEDEV